MVGFESQLENWKKADIISHGAKSAKKNVCCGKLLEVNQARQIEQKNIDGLQINQIVNRNISRLQNENIK